MKYPYLLLLISFTSCTSPNTIQRAEALKASTIDLIKERSFDAAIDSAKIALELYKEEDDQLGQAEIYYHIARASALDGNFSQAKEYGETGSRIALQNQMLDLEYKINNILSWSYFSLGMGFEETLAHQKRQLEVVKHLNDSAAKAMVYNNYGYDATVSGMIHLDSAVIFTKWANDYYGKKENTHGRWYTLMNLCWQYRLKNDFETSKAYGLHSLAQAKADSDRHAILEAATNLAETLMEQEKTNEVSEKLNEIYELANEENDRDKYVFDIYYAHHLGEAGKTTEAVALLKSAVDFLSEGEVFYEMLGRSYLAKYALQSGQQALAQEQINVFQNPRANYFSIDARVTSAIIEAKINSDSQILDEWINKCKAIGADQLVMKLENAKNAKADVEIQVM